MFLCAFLGGVVVLVCEYCCHFGKIKPRTYGLPITKFASTLCLKPTYVYQKATLLVYSYVNDHNSYQLDRTPPPPVRRHHQIAASGRDP
jgi:hypothetical protein